MTNQMIIKRLVTLLFTIGGLLLCDYIFYSMDGKGHWPTIVGQLCMVFLLVAALCDAKFFKFILLIGYVISFFIAYLGQKDSLDPGGGVVNNFFIIYLLSFFAFVLIALVVEVAKRVHFDD